MADEHVHVHTEAELADAKQLAINATEMIRRLCAPRNSADAQEWLMSIPARRDDPDVVLGVAAIAMHEIIADLRHARQIIEAISAERPDDAQSMCLFCGTWLPENDSEHLGTCPWRLARDYVAASKQNAQTEKLPPA